MEELTLQQRKKELQLSGEIAAAKLKETCTSKPRPKSLSNRPFLLLDARTGRSKNPFATEPTGDNQHQSMENTPKINSRQDFASNSTSTPRDELFQRIVEIQDQQSNALQQLIRQQQQGVLALTLPQPSMPVFSGNPVDYCDFIRSFEHLIESKTTSPSARLYYLVQHTSGSVQELMKSCLSMKEDEGYAEARKLLKERYGKEYRVAAAHLQRLVDGPPIKSEDANALQQFSIQITSCTNTLEKIGYLHKLNNSENLKKIVERLPYAMRVKWRDTRAANHPVFGKIAIEKPKPLKQNQRKSQYGKATGFATQSTSQSPKCPQCGSNHWLSRCDKFKKQSLEERQKFVREKKLCINCLSTGHYVRSCEKESFCKVDGCVGKHSTFLHPKLQQPLNNKKNDSKQEEKIPEDRRSEDNHSETQGNNANNGYVKSKPGGSSPITGLAIVPIEVKAKGSSKTVKTYAFLDSGSNTTFCTEKLLEELETHGTKTKLSLTTMQAENVPEQCTMVSLEISDLAGNSEINLPTVYSRPNLPIPKDAIGRQEDVNRWPYLTGIRINSIDADIGLLIGSDVPEALQPREMRQSQNGGPFATRTALGWVLNGPLGRNGTKTSTANLAQANLTLDEKFENHCNYEFNDYKYDTNPTMSQNDRKALGIMEESVKMENDHYEIALPWKNYPPDLPNNKTQAEHRLQLLKKRLNNNPELLRKYRDFMDKLFEKDYASEAINKEEGSLGTRWYLPHHPVFHPQKPDKVRVVFDCSAKYGNTSLNDRLLQGPDLTNSLVGVLTRFREEPIAFMSDIEAMFHQVRVRPSDRDALRFLWWPNGNLENPPEEYQMNVHLFGGTSSPSCANYALKKTAMDNASHFHDKTIETVKRNFYVDDCLKSVRDEEEAIKLSKELRELLSLGGFNLTKWLSNSRKVIESLPEAERAAQVKDLDFDKIPIERALGVRWNVSSDTFGFAIVIKERPATRRGILSIVSSIYYPLGFVAPYILSAKLILQELCRLKLDWDEKIPDENLKHWQAWLHDLPQLENLAVERCFKPATMNEIKSTQLHHFSDASQQGYGAVSYIRIEDISGNVKCSFVMGKSRLAPMKPVTIPRMELSAAVVSTKLDKISRNELSLPTDQSFFWTDSTCVLRYIENTTKRFQTFVANRIATIHDASTPKQWNYVDTRSNPADDASRGVPADSLAMDQGSRFPY
ncbi:uncharacterized protein LOC114538415 [Dendronephthya gigantea]|uniref:uncharacterized protein LOC114538415 n=1 Tax=Dendronephthya gigantea TaxID=151771 RepID=UPI0010690613|nr:uncharacterized protein LOC114538415 [Dendronephthya gigantea]